MKNQAKKIKLTEIKTAINSSGYLLEQRIEALLQKKGFYVTTNDAYIDPATGKSRELDVDAIYGSRLSRDYDFTFLRLLCECENNQQPVVFFTKDPIDIGIYHYDVKIAGLPIQFLWKDGKSKKREFISIVDFLRLDKYHHYCKGLVSTQYCSFTSKKADGKWLAQHPEDQHNSLVDLIYALEARIDEYYENYSLPGKNDKDQINIEFYLPVLVLQGDLLLANQTKNGLRIKKADYIKYKKEYFFKGKRNTYVIDVVTEKYFTSYLKMIVSEFEKSSKAIKNKKILARLSLDKLVEKARLKDHKDNFRKIFEF